MRMRQASSLLTGRRDRYGRCQSRSSARHDDVQCPWAMHALDPAELDVVSRGDQLAECHSCGVGEHRRTLAGSRRRVGRTIRRGRRLFAPARWAAAPRPSRPTRRPRGPGAPGRGRHRGRSCCGQVPSVGPPRTRPGTADKVAQRRRPPFSAARVPRSPAFMRRPACDVRLTLNWHADRFHKPPDCGHYNSTTEGQSPPLIVPMLTSAGLPVPGDEPMGVLWSPGVDARIGRPRALVD